MNQRQLADRASISGHTKLLVILAHPVEHVRTPSAMNAHLAAISADAVLVPMQVRPEDLADTVLMLRRIENLVGIVVTIPHKEKIVALCDELTEAARLVGAVNVIRREADGRLCPSSNHLRLLCALANGVSGPSVVEVKLRFGDASSGAAGWFCA